MTPALRGHVAMLAFSGLVAGSFSLGALAAKEMAPAALNAVRFWIATVIIGIAAKLTGALDRAAFVASWRYLILGGLFGLYFVLMFEGLKTAAPVSAAAVFTLTPIMAAAFGYILMRQMMTAEIAFALAIGAAGALWVIFRADWRALLAFDVGRGEWVYLVGCALHALYTPMVRKLNRGENALVFTFGTLLAGSVLLTVLGWQDLRETDWHALPQILWVTLIYLAVAASAGSFVLLQYAALRLPSAKVMAYTYLTPSWVICWEIALGNPAPQALVLVGVALTVGALLLLLREEQTA